MARDRKNYNFRIIVLSLIILFLITGDVYSFCIPKASLRPPLVFIKDKGDYVYTFPQEVFSEEEIYDLKDRGKNRARLENRNWYYERFSKKRQELLLDRIESLEPLIEYLRNYFREKYPGRKIVNISTYGSYLYGEEGYIPDDIDLSVVLEGVIFKYFDMKEPEFNIKELAQNLGIPINKLGINVYGEDVMTKGKYVDDTVIATVTHEKCTFQLLSIAYYRDVVIYGKDYRLMPDNKNNLMITAGILASQVFDRCYPKTLYKTETESTRLKRIISRIVDINLMLATIDPEIEKQMDFSYLFSMAKEIMEGKIRAKDVEVESSRALKLYQDTVKMFSNCPRLILGQSI